MELREATRRTERFSGPASGFRAALSYLLAGEGGNPLRVQREHCGW